MRMIVCLVGLLAFCAGALGQSMDTLPKGFSIYERADTLPALIAKTKPILTFPYYGYSEDTSSDTVMFVWSAKNADGQRTFTLAAADRYWPKGGKGEWVILKQDAGTLDDSSPMLPVTKITVTDKKPAPSAASTVPWARVASVHPQNGTLYEIGYFLQSNPVAAQEWREYIMHDPAHGWRFVAELPGDSDDGAVNKLNIQWTGRGETPLELTLETAPTARTGHVARYTEERYTGKLPLTKPRPRTITFAPRPATPWANCSNAWPTRNWSVAKRPTARNWPRPSRPKSNASTPTWTPTTSRPANAWPSPTWTRSRH